MNKYRSFGIMRSGIHVILGWLINKFADSSVLFYNNVRDPTDLADRLITPTDTRIGPIAQKLVTRVDAAQCTILSFESKPLPSGELDSLDLLIIRNPFNLLASTLAYIENGGSCRDIVADNSLKEMWKIYARQALSSNKYVVVIYDRFLVDAEYRRDLSRRLHVPNEPDELLTLKMGGGSSFVNTSSNFMTRYFEYLDAPIMQDFLQDKELQQLWKQLF